MNYYNENDPFAATWLRELIRRNLISQGDVDERSIADVRPSDLAGYAQCHFFAGIGGWSYALRLAGWPDDKPCWTGSCPCQPFSAAGKGLGFDDPRHLWPQWFRLIRVYRPVTILGEQVDKALGWLDLVSGDLEGEGYAVGSAVVGAHSVGAPHRRQRIYWVVESQEGRCERESIRSDGESTQRIAESSILEQSTQQQVGIPRRAWVEGSAVAQPDESRHSMLQRECDQGILRERDVRGAQSGSECSVKDGRMAHLPVPRRSGAGQHDGGQSLLPARSAEYGFVGNAQRSKGARLGQHCGERLCVEEPARLAGSGSSGSWWRDADWLWCRDSKYRPVEPGTFPLAHGISSRVGRLRGYGNAIVPQVAAEFISAYLDTLTPEAA